MRIVVVDDHHLFRAGVRAELAAHHEVVGEAATPTEAIAVIAQTKPDVVLLDVHLPEGGGVAVLEALKRLEDAAARARAQRLRRRRGRGADDPRGRARLRDQDDRHRRAARRRWRPSTTASAAFSPRLAAFVLQAFSAPPVDELEA